MPDHTNDIDALLDYLASHPFAGYHRALTALVAERDALKKRVEVGERQLRLANIDQFNAEAEAADRDRELRERLVAHVENLRAELAAMREQRDEARENLRDACEEIATRVNSYSMLSTNKTAETIAVERGWDCYGQGGGA